MKQLLFKVDEETYDAFMELVSTQGFESKVAAFRHMLLLAAPAPKPRCNVPDLSKLDDAKHASVEAACEAYAAATNDDHVEAPAAPTTEKADPWDVLSKPVPAGFVVEQPDISNEDMTDRVAWIAEKFKGDIDKAMFLIKKLGPTEAVRWTSEHMSP